MNIFDSPTIRVRAEPGADTSLLIVTFVPLEHPQTLDNAGFAAPLLRKLGISGLFFTVSDNNWYQTPDMPAALDAAAVYCRGFGRVVTYGSSMGAYAAVIASRALGADAIIAMTPQFSIDPAKVPFEQRWRRYASALDFLWDDMPAGIAPNADLHILYDPVDALDAKQVALFRPHTRSMAALPLPFSGHPVLPHLIELELHSEVVEGLTRGTTSVRDLRQIVRARRAGSACYWAHRGLARARRHPVDALFSLLRAEACSAAHSDSLPVIERLRAKVSD
jgi:hypothetical protein